MKARKSPQMFEVGGRTFDVRKHDDGTWWLMLWVRPNSSVRVGIFANEIVARAAAAALPADYDPWKAATDFHGFRIGAR